MGLHMTYFLPRNHPNVSPPRNANGTPLNLDVLKLAEDLTAFIHIERTVCVPRWPRSLKSTRSSGLVSVVLVEIFGQLFDLLGIIRGDLDVEHDIKVAAWSAFWAGDAFPFES